MAKKTASNLIGELSRFFNWLHRSPEWDWRKPLDYDEISHRPIELESDLEVEAREIPTYTVDQLRILYRHATPLERLLLVLGINCAYGADQAGRLKAREIHEKNGVCYIKRIRRKQKVRGIHRLFKVTSEGLRWAIRGREDQPQAFVLVNGRGNPLWRKTKGGRRCRDIPNAWNRLLDRVCAAERMEGREFPRHGYNTLRDTSADMIRRIAGGEVASAHLTHKHQSADKNLRRYSNVPWKTVFKAQRRLEKKLVVVFEDVEEPLLRRQGATKDARCRRSIPRLASGSSFWEANHVGLDNQRDSLARRGSHGKSRQGAAGVGKQPSLRVESSGCSDPNGPLKTGVAPMLRLYIEPDLDGTPTKPWLMRVLSDDFEPSWRGSNGS